MDWLEVEVRLPSRKGLAWAEYWLNTHAHGAMVVDPYAMQEESATWEAHGFSHEALHTEEVVLTTWITTTEKERLGALELAFDDAAREGVIDGYDMTYHDSPDWLSQQNDIYAPRPAGKHIQVLPVGKEPLADRPIIATIDPGIGFGTGEHPTTILALTLMEKEAPLKGRVFDVGCGNGVLGIVAKKLGAATVFALDHDPMAVKQARKNAELSDASIVFEVSSLLDGTDLAGELIVANIITDILLELIPALDEHLLPHGKAILSGIEIERATEVYDALWYAGFEITDKLETDEWVAVTARKRSAVTLGDLTEALKAEGLLQKAPRHKKQIIRDITYDSRKVKPEMLFICKGQNFQPIYAQKAAKQGASIIMGDHQPEGVDARKMLLVKDIRRSMAVVARTFFGKPDEHLAIHAITATKGKSTTVNMLADILDENAKINGTPQPAVISTACLRDGLIDEPAKLTTPENVDLYRHLRRAQARGLEQVVLEVSSQALKYHRVYGMQFTNVAFMNISPDHIGPIEHTDFDDYFQSKCMIFKTAQRALIPAFGEHSEAIRAAAEKAGLTEIYTVALEQGADAVAHSISEENGCSKFYYASPWGAYWVEIPMPGRFNVENAIYAISMASLIGIKQEVVQKAMAESRLAGRMEIINGDDITVWVDYAHNGLAFQKVLSAAKESHPKAPLWLVFGAPGGKAQSRRHDLGNVAQEYADEIILTADDPAKEAVSAICAEIAEVMPNASYQIIEDRGEAIKTAILNAPKGAVVLLLGKGAETAQKGPHGPEDWVGDVKMAQTALNKRKKS